MVPNTAYGEGEDVQRWLAQLFVSRFIEVDSDESEARLVRMTLPRWERDRSV